MYSVQSGINNSNHSSLCIETLCPNIITEYIKEICLIDSSSDVELEKWDINNFLCDLPDKWKLSHFAFVNRRLAGYIICSKKEEDNVHIHRFVVLKNIQNQGIGSKLLNTIFERVGNGNLITLKVKKHNLKAISFYEKKGFVRYAEEDVNYLYKKIV